MYFGCQPHLSSGVHKTVTTASGTDHIFCAATSLQRGQAWPRWRKVATQYRRLHLQFWKKSIYYSASSLYMFRVSTTPINRSTQNCNYSIRYWSYLLCSYLPPTWPSLATLEEGSCTIPEAVVTVLKKVYLLFCKFTLHVSGVNHTYHQEYTKLQLQPLVLCSYLLRTWPSLATLEGGSCTKIWPLPEAIFTVLCTPDDGCGWHPKHVEWTCRIINRLLCVASRWTIINTDQRCTET